MNGTYRSNEGEGEGKRRFPATSMLVMNRNHYLETNVKHKINFNLCRTNIVLAQNT